MIFASPHRAGWIKIQQRPSPAVRPICSTLLLFFSRRYPQIVHRIFPITGKMLDWLREKKTQKRTRVTKISRHDDRLMTERPKWLPYKKDRLPYNPRLYNRQESVLRGHRIFRDNLLAYKLHSKAALSCILYANRVKSFLVSMADARKKAVRICRVQESIYRASRKFFAKAMLKLSDDVNVNFLIHRFSYVILHMKN